MDWTSLRNKIENELHGNILPFWMNHIKDPDGGLYGFISNNNKPEDNSPRGLVMTARLLWTYAEAYRLFPKKEYLEFAVYIREYLMTKLWDNKHEGFFWTVNTDGTPGETKKILYGQAFALYGLSTFQQISPSEENKIFCSKLFSLLEKHGKDHEFDGYYEACNRDWTFAGKNNLGVDDQPCEKSMNTNLHMLEAYTRYFLESGKSDVETSLKELISIITGKIFNESTGHQELYFSRTWEPSGNIESYGHDVETSWLLWEALEILDDDMFKNQYRDTILRMLSVSNEKATAPDGSLYNEKTDNHLDKTRIWWVQAEHLVSLMNGWEMTGNDAYREKLFKAWKYIEDKQKDTKNGEWFWGVNDDGSILDREKGGMWKTPYHNGRACMELINRINKITETDNV